MAHCLNEGTGTPVVGSGLVSQGFVAFPPTHSILVNLFVSPKNSFSAALIAVESLMDWNLTGQLQLQLQTLSRPCQDCILDGNLINQVNKQIPSLLMHMSGNVIE